MRFSVCLLAAVVTVNGAPSALASSSGIESRNEAAVDVAPVSSAPFITFAGHNHAERDEHLHKRGSAPVRGPIIVKSTGEYRYVGCYKESDEWRALRGKVVASDSMTVEKCADACKGFTWFGLEYARECYCGNELQPGSVPEPATDKTQCTMTCAGNSIELCGGPARLQMYNNIKPATSSSSMTSTSSKTSTSSTTSASSTASTTSSSSSTKASTTSTSTPATSTTTSTSSSKSSTASSSSTTSSTSSTFSTTSTKSSTSTTSTTSMKSSTTSTTSTTSSKSSTTSSSTTSTTSSKPPNPIPTGRAVFAHYMVSGITQDQANADIQQAKAMGIDAFSLNVVTASESWSNDALQCLFNAAQWNNFKLFLSFDMSRFWSPQDAIPLLQRYYQSPAYYKYDGKYFVSTFNGGCLTFGYPTPNAGWQDKYRNYLSWLNIPTYFVPAFDDSPVDPSQFFNTFPVTDGLFAWENSWPWASQGKSAVVSSSRDQAYFNAAKQAGKTFMMGISALQFKHMSGWQNYYRTGGLDLALRIGQVLSLGPDFVQIQSWNDAGESHYIGNVWPWALSGTNVGSYTDGYDHSGWQVILKPFMVAYKLGITDVADIIPTNGALVQGVFWHNTLLSTASCYGDWMGKPNGWENIRDSISVAIIVAPGATGVKVLVWSGGQMLAQFDAKPGLNTWEVPGMKAGQVKVEVKGLYGQTLVQNAGWRWVEGDSWNCNFNPQVVPLV